MFYINCTIHCNVVAGARGVQLAHLKNHMRPNLGRVLLFWDKIYKEITSKIGAIKSGKVLKKLNRDDNMSD